MHWSLVCSFLFMQIFELNEVKLYGKYNAHNSTVKLAYDELWY